jgi:hypothetical protein
LYPGYTPILIFKQDETTQYTSAKIELLSEVKELYTLESKPTVILNSESESEPIGYIDETFIFNCLPRNICFEAIVTASNVGTRIMNTISI